MGFKSPLPHQTSLMIQAKVGHHSAKVGRHHSERATAGTLNHRSRRRASQGLLIRERILYSTLVSRIVAGLATGVSLASVCVIQSVSPCNLNDHVLEPPYLPCAGGRSATVEVVIKFDPDISYVPDCAKNGFNVASASAGVMLAADLMPGRTSLAVSRTRL